MSFELTQQQYNIFKELKLLDPQPLFKGFPQLTALNPSNSQEQSNSQKQKWLFYDVDYDVQHQALRQKLLSYRQKSEQIYQVGELLKEYQSKFGDLMQDKDKLIDLIKGMKGDTSQLVEKQKKLIDLSMKMKESLDYYSYHSKFSFEYSCEIACREMFENILQQTLSELTDGIQYFQENSTYSQSKKYLSMFQNSRSKVLSFVKSFFIKLFNKQSQFMNKNQKLTFNGFFETFYPKSKFKFISTFLAIFPQFAPKLEHILKSVKQSSNQQELKFLQLKQLEIFEFQLNKNNQALIGYLQKHMPQIYEESILHFLTYYRTAFHQNLAKNDKKDISSAKAFNEKFIEIIYLLTSEYAYMCYCCRITSYQKAQLIRNSISSLSKLYFEDFYKASKQVRNQSTFEVCEILLKIKESLSPFLHNHVRQEYQSYALGAVGQSINDPQHLEYLRSLFDLYVNKFLSEMEITCYNKFPVFQIKTTKSQVQNQIREFLQCIPKLRFCQTYVQKYLIGTLDCLVKSIKEANSKIESRFECYVWNIELFFTIRQSLKGIKGSLIRKELKFDTNNSSNMLQKVKNIQRSESLIKYAQDLFNVIKTGMPVINELTLDFNKYINQHCEALQSQFVKDILYIYAKNMIQFLQKFSEAKQKGQQQLKVLCQSNNIQALYNSYTLSIQKYTKDAQILMKQHHNYRFNDDNTQIIRDLLNLIYDRLFDFMDKFYVNVSPFVTETQNFKEIEVLKSLYKKAW